MWAQTWGNIADLGVPYPDVQAEDVTKYLVQQVIQKFEIISYYFNFLNSIFSKLKNFPEYVIVPIRKKKKFPHFHVEFKIKLMRVY